MFGIKSRKKAIARKQTQWVIDGLVDLDMARSGLLITGAPGSGKTTTIGREIRRNLLSHNKMGGLILMAKVNEMDNLIADCKATGRLDDLVHVYPGGPHCCDFLDVILKSPGGTPQLATAMLATVNDMEARKKGGADGDGRYWNEMLTKAINASITLCWQVNGRVRLADIFAFFTTAANSPQQFQDAGWRRDSFVWKVLSAAPDNSDCNLAYTFWAVEWPNLDVKPRSICQSVATNLLMKFLSSDVSGMISGNTTISPFDAIEGKILALDTPVTRTQGRGVMSANMFKMLMHHIAMSRPITPDMKDVFLFMDECHNFLQPEWDSMVATMAREYRLIIVNMFQNYPIVYQALGGSSHAIHAANGWSSCHGVRAALANSCVTTGRILSEIYGNSWRYVTGDSTQMPGEYSLLGDMMGDSGGAHMTVSRNQQFLPDVQVSDFTLLHRPTRAEPFADGYLFMNGFLFENGKPWIKARFPRIE